MATAADSRPLTVVQVLPALDMGGVERGTLEVARRLVAEGHRSIVVAAGGRLAAQLVAEGSTHVEWDVGAKRLATLRWIPKIKRLLRDERPDILHLRSRLPAWMAYLAWRGLPAAQRPALVTTVHGYYSPGRYSGVMLRGDYVIAISEAVRAYVLQHYPRVDAARIRVIPRGVDPAAYPYGYRPPAAWLADWHAQQPGLQHKYVLTLPGRLTRLKGQRDFIAVIAALRRLGIPAHGLLVGGTHPRKRHYEAELRAEIAAAGVADAVTLLGHRGDLREIMAVSDVVLSLSTEPEAFGRVCVEALSLGRPVLGYDHGGVGEQLRAILPVGAVPLGERAEVVARLAEWYRAPPAVPREQPYTLERMLGATLALYREAAAARATTTGAIA